MSERDDKNRGGSERSAATCPVCKRRVAVAKSGSSGPPKFFPFCSERCKLIDLGAWLDAEYRIPAKPDEDIESPLEERGGDIL